MICESCKTLPSQPGKALCRYCEKVQIDTITETEVMAYKGQFSETRYSQDGEQQTSHYFVGYLKSHNEVEELPRQRQLS